MKQPIKVKGEKKTSLRKDFYYALFNKLMVLGTYDLTLTKKKLEALDLLANYCGDRYTGRKK